MTSCLLAIIVLLLLLPLAVGATQLPPGDWISGWSGLQAQVQPSGEARSPDGEAPLRFVWTKPADNALPNMSRSFPVIPAGGEVVAFWLRTDHPLQRLQVILLDADSVGAETGVPGLLSKPQIPAGEWQYVVWPFHTRPGWVRYARGVVDWERLAGISFYTWTEEIHEKVTVEVGSFQVLTYAELEAIFEAHPDRVNNNRGVPWRVLGDQRADLLVPQCLAKRAEEKTAALRRKYPARKLPGRQAQVRDALAATYLRPEVTDKPTSTCVGMARVDGVAIERRVLRIADGFYSTANVYLPYDPEQGPPPQRYPALLSLPGHGDPNWSAVNQERGLTLAKRGYIAMWVQPFGQVESGDEPTWNEAHGGQSMAYLLTTGQSLMGMIMAAHQAELTDLLARPDVEPSQVGLTGISMGGTHSLWFAALDPRVKATVAISIAPLARPETCFIHHCLCDLMVGQFNAADEEMVQALCAPRPFLHLYPDGEAPLAEEGRRKLFEGWINAADALKQYGMDEAQLAQRHSYAREVYAAAGNADGFRAAIVAGPHAYFQPMRERAGGWFDHWFRGAADASPTPDPTVQALTPWRAARAVLNIWPDGNRPPGVLGPTAYTQRETARLIAKLPPPPDSARAWQTQRRRLAEGVRQALGVDLSAPQVKPTEVGRFRVDGAEVRKLVIHPDPDMPVPMLLFAPVERVTPDGRLVVLLDPAGMASTCAWPRRLSGRTPAGAPSAEHLTCWARS